MRLLAVALALFVAPMIMAPSCGSSQGVKREGDTCTRTNDCDVDLVCVAGRCAADGDGGRPHDAGPDSGSHLDSGLHMDGSLSDADVHD
ncbi:MAG: hypothetical protein IPK60_16275 [Sandaracinaceae bacterium]|jgi:hypothetical protein|nr:hypothetical protein [Sandaracinaceae bacterium]